MLSHFQVSPLETLYPITPPHSLTSLPTMSMLPHSSTCSCLPALASPYPEALNSHRTNDCSFY